jgi:hypothetical protein
MAREPTDPLAAFHWTPQPKAESLVKEIVAGFLARNSFARDLARRMRDETGTRFLDWIDHLACPDDPGLRRRMADAGFVEKDGYFAHEGGIFPAIILRAEKPLRVGIKVESVIDFLSVWQVEPPTPIDTPALAPLRQTMASSQDGTELWIVERHGLKGFRGPAWTSQDAMKVLHVQELMRRRPRTFADETDGFRHTHALIGSAVKGLGAGYAADLFFASEREYWQRRNRAARAQKARQDRLGLGWANHDHHTYRSSRRHFAAMIQLFEALGLVCRERFYAGADAGWGAQVMEHPQAGIIVFADVDLSPDELRGDFAHDGLSDRKELGTVGLWCALHGEAILQAGMHHLECQFDFEALQKQLEQEEQIKVMKPFTNFSYLRQAFTEGEMWPVEESRLAPLVAAGQITAEKAEQFRRHGALGSHLENLERNEGFKGFNQTGVSDIIARTDPRGA